MSQKIQFFLTVLIAIALFGLLLRSEQPQTPTIQEIQITQPEERSITVIGEGELKVKPDTMDFTIVIQTKEKELAPARDENERISQKVISALEKNAMPESGIESDFLRITTDATSTRVYAYIVSNYIRVTIHSLTKIETLFTDILDAGATKITGIYFRISSIERYKDQVRQMAIKMPEKKQFLWQAHWERKLAVRSRFKRHQTRIDMNLNIMRALPSMV